MATYTVLVHEAEEGGYWAEVPELPGCASQGETLDELERNIVEAIEACLEAQLEDEGELPERRVRKWEVSVPDLSRHPGKAS
jgi:predicted RNase H-like HicB family nuclease